LLLSRSKVAFFRAGGHNMDTRQRLRKLIEQSDTLTFVSVSVRAGLSDSAVHKYCTGRTQSMTTDNLQKVAVAAGVSLRWLLFGEETSPVMEVFERIPESRRQQAIELLESMAGVAPIAAIDGLKGDVVPPVTPQPYVTSPNAIKRDGALAS
jgi:transcriptional regulator with XRE-family HTH domain